MAVDRFGDLLCYTLDDFSGATIECVRYMPLQRNTRTTLETTRPTTHESTNNENTTITKHRESYDFITNGIDINSIVKIEGSFRVFRGMRQIKMASIQIIPDTNAELDEIKLRTAFMRDVLMKPWHVSRRHHKTCVRREDWRQRWERKLRPTVVTEDKQGDSIPNQQSVINGDGGISNNGDIDRKQTRRSPNTTI